MNLLIFASGKGSNFEAIVKACKNAYMSARVVGLICDKECPAIQIAKDNLVPHTIVSPKSFDDKKEYISQLIATVTKYAPDLIILAGYMRIVPSELIDLYPLKIINIHPSLLPDFPGKDSIRRAWDAKVRFTGVTVHYVNEKLDQGPIIDQWKVDVPATFEELEAAIHEVEHKMYPATIKKITEAL
jgi:phosphoribosylglycinamide formyltransferase-1